GKSRAAGNSPKFWKTCGGNNFARGSESVNWRVISMTLELNTFLNYYLPEFEAGGLSILWSLFALGFIVSGIWKQVRALRLVGLGLFAVVACKVFLIDLARLDPFYRIIAFIVLGMLVLSGSFIYLKYRQ